MAARADLPSAASHAFIDLGAKWNANTLVTALSGFAAALKNTFLESNPTDHPCGNWLAVIAALAVTMPQSGGSVGAPAVTFEQMSDAAKWVAALCILAQELGTSAQQAAVLVAYNGNF